MMQKIFHGILLINKEKGCTSHQVVSEIRRILKQQPVGHAGTLDPQASGLLVILCGLATKLSPYFTNQNKRYKLEFQLGLETNTFDLQGKILKQEEVSLKKSYIQQVLEEETGDLEIPVPVFSAVKVKGKRLYSYGFAGKEKEIQPPIKKMSFWNLDIHEIQKDKACLSISCSKGSYIRSWVHHLGQKMQTGACLTRLERLSSGIFDINHSLTIENLKNKLQKKFPEDEKELQSLLGEAFFLPNSALSQFPELKLTNRNTQILKKGILPGHILSAVQKDQIHVNKKGHSQILKAVRGEQLVALLEMRPFQKIRILKNFPHQHF